MRKSHVKSHKKYFREILFVFSGVKIKAKMLLMNICNARKKSSSISEIDCLCYLPNGTIYLRF